MPSLLLPGMEGGMEDFTERNTYDRTARLQRVIYILNQNPQGMPAKEIADQCGVKVRTVYRDLKALDGVLKVPLWADKGKWGIEPGHYLPPISFSLPEAMTIFLASRLLLAYSNAYNPSIESTFMKLNSIVPGPLREQIGRTIEWTQKQKKDRRSTHILETVARSWIDRRKARIRYRPLNQPLTERTIEPYFIQPAALEHANYVIAYCHLRKSILMFKIERIENIALLDESYTVPDDFDVNKYLGSAWGVIAHGETKTIKLRFNPQIATIAEETTWHPSQVTQRQPDGSATVTMNLALTVELEAFILGWAEKVEVIEPEELRDKIARAAQATADVYKQK